MEDQKAGYGRVSTLHSTTVWQSVESQPSRQLQLRDSLVGAGVGIFVGHVAQVEVRQSDDQVDKESLDTRQWQWHCFHAD